MTVVTLIMFGSVILMGVCLGYWLTCRSKEATALPNSKTLRAEARNLKRYRVLTRLLTDDDGEFVAENKGILGPKAAERLRRSRRRILRSYLRELRRDFVRFWSLCRLLAPYAPDPEFGAMLMSQLFLFHSTLTVVWLRTFSPSVGRNQIQFTALANGAQ